MPIGNTGEIKMSFLAKIVKNATNATINMGDSEVRKLLLDETGPISMSSARNKPVANNSGTSYYVAGNFTWVVQPYEYLYANVRGGGGGGGMGGGGQNWFYGCINGCKGGAGGNAQGANFNGISAYGGGGGGQAQGMGGNSLNGTLGGGAPGGAGGGGAGGCGIYGCCNQYGGAAGKEGGFVEYTWKKNGGGVGSGAPAYGASINFFVGAGGTGTGGCGGIPGQNGYPGSVYLQWS